MGATKGNVDEEGFSNVGEGRAREREGCGREGSSVVVAH